MRKKYILFAASAIATLIWYSCKKTEQPAKNSDISGKNALFSDLRYTPQRFTVEAGRDTSILGADSTVLHFYANSFKDPAGNVVTRGKVGIELIEMYRPADMMLNRAMTSTTDDYLLESGGQVIIKAVMNGVKLSANKYGIAFKASQSATEPMSIFYGNQQNQDSVVKWTESPEGTGTRALGAVWDTTGRPFLQGNYYNIFDSVTDFYNINCDRLFDPNKANTHITVVIEDHSFNLKNLQLFVVLPEINSSTTGGRQMQDGEGIYQIGNNGNLIPVGMKYVLVAIAKKEDNYYFDMQSGTITENMTVKMNPSPETRYNIKARLSGIQ